MMIPGATHALVAIEYARDHGVFDTEQIEQLTTLVNLLRGDPPPEVRYKMADGSMVGGEFTYVGELEYFDDCDEPIELKSERYTHVSQSAQMYLECLAEAEAEDAEGD